MKFKRLLKYLFFILFISSIAFLYSFSNNKNMGGKISEITIDFKKNKHSFLTPKMVNKLLIQNNDSLQNKAKSVIDLYTIENQVSKNPYVEEANVFLTIEGELKSIIKQRDPIARIISGEQSYYIDKQAVKVPLSSGYSARVLLVSGVKKQQDIKHIMPLLLKIEEDNFLKKEVIGIQKTNDNEYQLSVRSGQYKINLGKLSDIDLKFKKLKAFYNSVYTDKSMQNYKMINLKYHNQVVCEK